YKRQSLCFAGHDLMSQFAGNKEDIVGIGLGSIRCCRALLKADGTPAAPLISWQDARVTRPYDCLLYTSDAADEARSVDL
ncbi:hypothetical protein ELP57_40565, partial [Klebsiella pneumoniae]|nr:hypothetical protein [Klebsiella pneumoniae]